MYLLLNIQAELLVGGGMAKLTWGLSLLGSYTERCDSAAMYIKAQIQYQLWCFKQGIVMH